MSKIETIELEYPIEVEGAETIKQFKLRRLRVADLQIIQEKNKPIDQNIKAISLSTGHPESDIVKMDARDWARVLDFVENFIF